ncbi:MAG TPA: ABC transporter substrate-binding protein, partial [Acetobacteraceae bacterium]
DYAHVSALKDGTVESDRLRLDFVAVEPITRAFRRMVRALEFDVCEIALATLAQAHDVGKPIVGLPIVLMGGLHHGALVCMNQSGLAGPGELVGKRVGVRAYSQTTGVWLRGILRSDYAIEPEAITWVTEEDAHVQEYRDPPHVMRAPPGRSLLEMLRGGEIDAAIALRGTAPGEVRAVIPDAGEAAAAWSGRTGVGPVNHVVALRSDLLAEYPWLGEELFRMFAAAGARSSGEHPAYGMAANRTAIDLLLAFAAEQGLTSEIYRAEELFADGL